MWLAIIGSGAIASPINPAYTSTELERHLRLTDPKFIFTQPGCLGSIAEVASKCNIPNSHIFLVENNQEPNIHGCHSWKTILAGSEEYDPVPLFEHGRSLQGRLALYAMTSGTTGLPKAAMIPHRYVVAQAAALEKQFITRNYQVLSSLDVCTSMTCLRLTFITAITAHLSACLSRICSAPCPCPSPPSRHADLFPAKVQPVRLLAGNIKVRHHRCASRPSHPWDTGSFVKCRHSTSSEPALRHMCGGYFESKCAGEASFKVT